MEAESTRPERHRDNSDLRLFLQQELVSRLKANPRYSLRGFARALRIDPSLLSKILRGKRKISRNLLPRIVERLALSPEESQRFLNPPSDNAETAGERLAADRFYAVGDWYHPAICELTKVKRFQPQARWIAKALGIPVPEAQSAIDRLFRLGLLEQHEDGSLRAFTPPGSMEESEFSAMAQRRVQKKMLEMGIAALENSSHELSAQSVMTLAIDSRRVPEARERLRRFQQEMQQLLQSDGDRDGVYHLAISLYPVAHFPELPREDRAPERQSSASQV